MFIGMGWHWRLGDLGKVLVAGAFAFVFGVFYGGWVAVLRPW